MTDVELDEKLDAQARQDPKLRNVLELMRSFPEGGATERHMLLTALLEFSKHALIMQKLAEKLLVFSPVMTRLALPSIMEQCEKEVRGGG